MRKYYSFIVIILICLGFLVSCNINEKTNDIISEPTISIQNPSLPTEEETSPTIPNKTKAKNFTHYLGSDNNICRLYINTERGVFPQSKETYIPGYVTITEQNKSNVIQKTTEMKIRLRGNSSIAAEKKSFKIKFNEAQSLFGLTKAKDWVLIANYFDKTNIRNYLAYLTANKLDNLNFQPSTIFVDVYYNNKYYGLFLLCEQIEANNGRVDIKKNFSVDGISSFLLEADDRAKDEYRGFIDKCYISSCGYDLALKYPDADDYLEAYTENNKAILDQFDKDIDWLKSFMRKIESVLKTNDINVIGNYLDLDSFIDYYLVQEFFKNVDVASTSQFYVIDQKQDTVKLSCGPVWDFDIAAGVIDETSTDTYAGYINTSLFVRERDDIYKILFKNKTFLKMVQKRYTEVRNVFLEIFNEIQLVKNQLESAQNRNLEKWPFTDRGSSWIEIYALSANYYAAKSLPEHYNILTNFLRKQLALMDESYLIK